jgi:metal-responsive CopG/Arc/MetJ family transcriptional regulator
MRAGQTVDLSVESIVDMVTIRVALDKKLLQAADKAARRLKLNRSAMVWDAPREHLRRLETLALGQDRNRIRGGQWWI